MCSADANDSRAGEEQKIKLRSLPVAQKQILAYPAAQHGLYAVAGLNCVRVLMVDAVIFYPKRVEKRVAALFLVDALVGRTAFV